MLHQMIGLAQANLHVVSASTVSGGIGDILDQTSGFINSILGFVRGIVGV